MTRGVKGRPGAAVLLNGGSILSMAEESTRAGWRIMELIFPALPEGPSALPEPCLLPGSLSMARAAGLLKVQSGKQLGFRVSTLFC